MYHIQSLIRKSLRGEITPAEQAELQAWLDAAPENRAFFEQMNDPQWVEQVLTRMDRKPEDEAWERLQERLASEEYPGEQFIPMRRAGWRRWAVAAAIITVLLGAGTWWVLKPILNRPPVAVISNPNDVPAPAVTRATITLSNGQQVYLDSAVAGTLATQGNVQLIKGERGQIAYRPAGTSATGIVMYNTLNNPRGSKVVDMVLSDGTHVWLNAASSIRYPASFPGNERQVEITGEAYFEVAHHAAKPFRVQSGDQLIEDIGTTFNINAYPDEPVLATTLLEGSVQVTRGGRSVVLTPGQQAVGPNSSATLSLSKGVNTEAVMAWKNGLFSFSHTDLRALMRQMARWYNVDITYEGGLPDRYFSGSIDRMLTLGQVLKILTNSRVHYSIEPGAKNKLIIRP